ncbi:kinesin-like protein KIF20B isoform X2 [Sphaerodactylus townsendi]|uniref:kinesin-like protein KIF20B isoform X2 n=1 Tax=Sphaerodactylus townsendi TaxID=933632 RepID=UPI0020268340|nr:kinesin-like protein KIF20B isoform X2 [Sphaerodactylus townsendi]
MEADLNKPAISRLSFVTSVEVTPRFGSLDATDIKRSLYEDFSSSSDISQRESLESRECIDVCLRIRPLTQAEKETEFQGCVSILDLTSVILKAPKSSTVFRLSEKNLRQVGQTFTFSQVFGPETTQEEFFASTVKQQVQDFLRGYSRLVFTYGVTNAGKTYTYQGTEDSIGILPRALDMLFRNIQGKLYPKMDFKPHRCRDHRKLSEEEVREEILLKSSLLRLVKEVYHQNDRSQNHNRAADNSEEVEKSSRDEESGAKFSVWVSFCEIYNECIYDLLLPVANDKRRRMLYLAQDIKGCSYVKDLQWIQVSNAEEAFKLVKLGLKNQSFASTKLNANSSRSHSIFSVKMLRIDSNTTEVVRVSELFLCDLAGSERCTRTRNEGERLKESGNINASLLILGKCINALKASQQSKLQQHIPFRESKLTHFFQGFFSGKGKVCMIVNISPSAAAYDETLNVLKFSAIAQKVIVLDSSNSSQEQTHDQKSITEELVTVTEAEVGDPLKRTTILWERTLEDVVEDEEELTADSSEVHEICVENNTLKVTESEDMEETPSQTADEDEVVIGKEEYLRLVNIVEDLKNKLINERKEKLLMELRIRKEVTQEYARYLADNEKNLKALAARKQELVEDNCERRMEIYKDFVKEYIPLVNNGARVAEGPPSDEQDRPQGDAARGLGSPADFLCMVESLQHNVSDIKQQAETVFEVFNTLEDPPQTIERLEKQLADVTAELSKIKEELTCRNEDMKVQENKLTESAQVLQEATEKMVLQNARIQKLTQIVEQKDHEINKLKDLVDHLETIKRDLESTITTIKQQMEQKNQNKKANCAHSSEPLEKHLDAGRKRCLEREEEEEGPPSKQGTKQLEDICLHTVKEEREMMEMEQKTKMLEVHLAALGEQLEKERSTREGLASKIAHLSQALSSSEELASGLRKELHQQQANNQEITSEVAGLKSLNKEQEEKMHALLEKLEAMSQMIAEKDSKVKSVEVKIGELSSLGSAGPTAQDDLPNQKDRGELSKDTHEEVHFHLGRRSSFHSSIESIWEMSKQVISISSQKSSQIKDLQQQVELLHRRIMDAEEEKSLLKSQLIEANCQVEASLQEKKCLLSQLKDLQEENALCSEKYKAKALEKIKNLDGLMEQYQAAEVTVSALEQVLKERDTAVSVAEREIHALQGILAVSESKIKSLSNQELQLKEQVQENLKTIEVLEKEKEESKQVMVKLKEDLLESTAGSSRLQVEIRQKEEEYTDLKEKLADAKKQIDQVQKEVCSMRTEEKLLRNRVNELEKSKKQLAEELEIKQRTIQQFKKEELNKKLEDLLQQQQKACEDLCSKEKIIEYMKLTLEEQEQTQSAQDQVLESRTAELERLAAELEGWKKRYHELVEQSSASGQQRANAEREKTAESPSEHLERLQEKLKECGREKHQTDRKKWLEEKMVLITQAKEAETHRNREMKRFVGDREHHAKLLVEVEKLVAEKENDLQKWRAERDQLVAAVEVQLSSLISSNAQKDAEIEELKKAALKTSTQDETLKELRRQLAERDNIIQELKQSYCANCKTTVSPLPVEAELHKEEGLHSCKQLEEKQIDNDLPLWSSTRASSVEDIQDQSEIILDSCEVSSENDKASRFPKPEMEIHFTPLQPNKMEVKHQGSPSTVTIKVPKARKRKSSAMDENNILSSLRKCKFINKSTSDGVGQEDGKSENEKNAESSANGSSSRQKKMVPDPSLKNNYSLRSKHFVGSAASPGNKAGSLHKFGNFLQSSPTILHTKAKKLMATIKSPKATEDESAKENGLKPKRAKRRLYNTDISSPMEFSGHVIVMDQKESDHEIIKRRLRTKRT